MSDSNSPVVGPVENTPPASPSRQHYCFVTLGGWQNPSFMRLRDIGTEMILQGIHVSYLIDDIPENHGDLKIHPKATIAFIPVKGLLASCRARRRSLVQLAPDFVHVLNCSPKAFLTLWRGHRIPIIADWDEWPSRRKLGWSYHLRSWFLEKWSFARAKRVFVASRYMQDEFRALGYDTIYLPYAAYLEARDTGTSPYHQPTAVYMGSYYSTYDHDLIFEAARLLKQRGKDFPITFIGDGPDRAQWEQFVRDHQLNNVTITGYVKSSDDLYRHLRHAHVLLFPIRHQILNLARCPAKTYAYAQARRPVVTCRVGEVPGVLGEAAEYIEPTAEAFANAIDRYLSQPDVPDVDYKVEQQNWKVRTDTLLAALPKW